MCLSEVVRLRVPKDFSEAVKTAAARRYLSPTSYIREAVAERLQRDGIGPNTSDCSEVNSGEQPA